MNAAFKIVLLSVFAASSLQAAPVYKSEKEGGVPFYSSKPASGEAKPAELPPIMRGEVKLVKGELVTCSNHGGINCQSGPDKDGSVICYDGFTGASARYRFSCNSPRLEIADVSEPDPKGAFKVSIRNTTSVVAAKPAVLYKPETGPQVKLAGPEEIEAFGMAEFLFNPPGSVKPLKKPDLSVIDITCANCPS